MRGLFERVPVDRVIVAIDPGKVLNRVWVTTGEGLVGEPVWLPTSRAGLDRLGTLVASGGFSGVALLAAGGLPRGGGGGAGGGWACHPLVLFPLPKPEAGAPRG